MINNRARQHTVRSPIARHAAAQSANTAEHHAGLVRRLTDRDRWIIRMVWEHRILTSHQITAMAFPSFRAARLRLRELYLWSVLDRFQPHTPVGSAPLHYVLGPAGATVLGAEHGLDPKQLGYRRERVNAIAHSLRLAHTVGVNDWFATLTTTHAARAGESTVRLTAWWSETRCTRHFGDLARPDAYGRISTPDGRGLEFFLEYDTGSEPLTRLAHKLPGYAALAASTGITTPLLIWLPTARRETTARPRLQRVLAALDPLPVATAAADWSDQPGRTGPTDGPADPVWLPLPLLRSSPRLTIADLVDVWPYLPPLAAGQSLAIPTHDGRVAAPGAIPTTSTTSRLSEPMSTSAQPPPCCSR
jgi:hypothetical protein